MAEFLPVEPVEVTCLQQGKEILLGKALAEIYKGALGS